MESMGRLMLLFGLCLLATHLAQARVLDKSSSSRDASRVGHQTPNNAAHEDDSHRSNLEATQVDSSHRSQVEAARKNKHESEAAEEEDLDEEEEDDKLARLDREPTEIDAAEGSRSTGGEPIEPKPWLAGAWFPKYGRKNEELLAGFMIRLNNNTVLTHRDTCDYPQMHWGGPRIKGEQITLQFKNTTNGWRGYPEDPHHGGCLSEDGEHLNHNFGIYQLIPQQGIHSALYFHMTGKSITADEIQNDPRVVDNCNLQSFRVNPANPKADWVFSRLPLLHIECHEDKCMFRNPDREKICYHHGDHSAPILCGKDQKLSYLAITSRSCDEDFKAIRLADHRNEIVSYLGREPVYLGLDHYSMLPMEVSSGKPMSKYML